MVECINYISSMLNIPKKEIEDLIFRLEHILTFALKISSEEQLMLSVNHNIIFIFHYIDPQYLSETKNIYNPPPPTEIKIKIIKLT